MIRTNIILTGFMGTGKTTTGKILARRLGRLFLDTDTLIEQQAGLSVPEIFAQYGEAYFRDCESAALESLQRYTAGSLVVATGGGAVLRDYNRKLMNQLGVVVLLTASLAAILRRVNGAEERPLLLSARTSARSSARAVLSLLAEREPCYADCRFTIDTTGKKPSRVAGEIIARLSTLR